jgi:hypothetical protein
MGIKVFRVLKNVACPPTWSFAVRVLRWIVVFDVGVEISTHRVSDIPKNLRDN